MNKMPVQLPIGFCPRRIEIPLMLLLSFLPAVSWAQTDHTREEFARALAKVAVGTSTEDVKQLIGSPDRILKISEDDLLEQRPEIRDSEASEVWDYGTCHFAGKSGQGFAG